VKRAAFLPLAIALIALAAACGGGSEPTPTPDLGLGGSLPRHLTAVSPAHGASVTNADLHAGETPGAQPSQDGICATFSFAGGDGMGDTTSVKLTVQGEDVTDSSTWALTNAGEHGPIDGGSICYTPPAAFVTGPLTVNVRYAEVTGREYTYSWQFQVTG
jgi:hypothetical protein